MENGIDEIKVKTRPILKEARVKHASLFGSLARGDAKKDSDLDIVVELAKGADPSELDLLRKRLSLTLGMRVDLVDSRNLTPWFKNKIAKDMQTINLNDEADTTS